MRWFELSGSRRWVIGLLVGPVLAMLAILSAPPASAASPLVASDPAPKEQLSDRPGWVTLAFSRTVKKSVVKVLVLGSDGRDHVSGDLIYQGSSVMVQLENDLPKGTYTVKYQINRPDGQPEGGAFQFAYGKGKWTDIQSSWSGTAEQPPEMKNPDPQATTAEETPTATPPPVVVEESPSVSATPSVSGTPTPGETATPAPQAPADNGPVLGWIVAAVVVVVAAAAGVAWWLVRRRRG